MAPKMKALVLTVDDEEFSHKVFQRVFADNDQWVWQHCFDTEEAESYLFERYGGDTDELRKPCLIILDVQLADDDTAGVELLKKVRGLDSHVHVVMCSVSRVDSIICDTYRAGARMYLNKPSRSREFEALVREVAGVWSKAVVCNAVC